MNYRKIGTRKRLQSHVMHLLLRWGGISASAFSTLFRRISLYVYIALLASLLSAYLLRNVSNWDFPLSGEFLTSPFHSEILKRSIGVWDEHFGLGFSNTLGSTGMAPYAGVYSGAMWITNNIVNTFFQDLGAAYFLNLVFSISLLSAGVYWVLDHLKWPNRNIPATLFISLSLVLIIHSTDFFLGSASSAGRFIAGQGLLLIAFIQYRQLSSLEFGKAASASTIPLALTLATLLLVFNPYFLAFTLLIGIQGAAEFVRSHEKRTKVAIFYAKILAISIALMVLVYGYVWLPPILSPGSTLMSGAVGRHDSPMQYPLVDLLRFFNNPAPDHFGWLGTWLQFGLAIFGIVLALRSPAMRWVRIDLLCIAIFVFLAKGSASPFPEVNQWLHVNIPFLRLLGSGYPYFGLVYTLLIYYLIYGLTRAFDISKKQWPNLGVVAVWVVIIGATLVSIFRTDAYLSGDFGGRVQSIEYPSEYYTFKRTAEQDMRIGRAYYFPDLGGRIGMDYVYSPTYTSRPMDCCYDLPFSSVFPIGIGWSNFNKYSGYYGQTMDFLMNHVQNADQLARVLSSSGTRYAVFDLSLKKTSAANYRMSAVRDQVRTSSLFVFKPALSNAYIEVYENLLWQHASSAASSLTVSTDDPNVFLDAARDALGKVDSPIVVAGAITLQGVKKLKDENILKNVLLYNSDDLGLMLDLIRSQYEMRPDANTMSSTGVSGWNTNNQVYQTQVTGKHGGRFIGRYPVATSSNDSHTSYYANISPGVSYSLYIRAMVSPDSGRVIVHVNNEKRQLDLRSKGYVGLQWFNLGGVSGASGKLKVEIESLDAGYLKRIDVMALVPRQVVTESSAIMKILFADINIERIEKTDYLEWKRLSQGANFNLTTEQVLGEKTQISPKKLSVTHHDFELHEDFDSFAESVGQESYNLVASRDENLASWSRYFPEKKFQRISGGGDYEFHASLGADAGTYSLGYEIESCQPFSNLSLNLKTIFVTADRSIQIFVSDNALSWLRVSTLVSDENNIIDLGPFVQGKRKVFLKLVYEKPNKGAVSPLLSDLRLHGVAGGEGMNCLQNLREAKPISPAVISPQQNNGHVATPYVALIDNSYDNNLRMNGISPLNVGYGFAAFPITNVRMQTDSKNELEYRYRILICISATVYLLLWITLFWGIYQRGIRRTKK